ncbi:unnamed protein product [Cylindrotheca closterium]|uniref:DUF6824 domain-containing protein n=1 Tax=Cylindrotheca closterium TaxID=2856 RepID=A0AAD2CVE9_9STRA|nr:unnamed protein product [Cylindrotheca closterium]
MSSARILDIHMITTTTTTIAAASLSSSPCADMGLVLKDSDIVCGRGGLANKHPGNRLLRRICHENRGLYQNSAMDSPNYKHCLILSIFTAIQQNGGRFVTRGKDGWKEISDKKAKEKTAQLLRESEPSSSASSISSTSAAASTKPSMIAQTRGTQKSATIKFDTSFFDTSTSNGNMQQAPRRRRSISPETTAGACYYTAPRPDTLSSSTDDLSNLLLQPILEPDMMISTPTPPTLAFGEHGDVFDPIGFETAAADGTPDRASTSMQEYFFSHDDTFQSMNHHDLVVSL